MEKLLQFVRQSVSAAGIFRPIIITDIDGVLLRGSVPIPGTLQALKKLKQHGIPLACLTNGGGYLETLKTNKMNSIFGQCLFKDEFMFMNHTPVRPHLKEYSKKKGVLLVTGSLRITEILEDMHIDNYVTADQLYIFLHQSTSQQKSQFLSFYQKTQDGSQVMNKVSERLKRNQLPTNYPQWAQLINSIFALNDVSPYETTLQVIHNIFAQKKRLNQQLPPYFASQNDIVWAGGYYRPRLAFGPFNYMLQKHCENYQFNLIKTYFGKPQKIAFKFVQSYMRQRFGQGCFFMIGDNPRADIRGANAVNWASFLTQTGVHHGAGNDQENPATIVVQNFAEAINLILKIKDQFSYR